MKRYWPMLLLLAALWGASYLFIKVAVEDIAPAPMMAVRTLLAAAVLFGYLFWRMGWGRAVTDVRAAWRHCAVLGVLNAAVPFWLIAWGEQHIDSGLASIFNASAPLFTALFAIAYDHSQRATGLRLGGILVGFAGVVLLAGFELSGGERALAGGLAIVAASACYAIGGLYAGRRFGGLPAPLVGFGTLVWATLFALPFGIADASMLGWEALLSVLYLGVVATGVAYLLYFGLIAGAGASKAVLVTYLVPSLALVYGAVFLDETVTAISLAGLALVLIGVALGTGTVRR